VPIYVPKDQERHYVDRHGEHSLNVMLVVGPKHRILFLKSNMPGSVNDCRVLFKSTLFDDFEAGYRPFANAVLLGDSIYPTKKWLIPMRARAHPQYNNFYACHAKTRNIVERSIGIWKMRWLSMKKGLRVKSPTYSAEIVKATGYLHNFLSDNRLPEEDDDHLFMEDELERAIDDEENNDNQEMEGFEFIYQKFVIANNFQQ